MIPQVKKYCIYLFSCGIVGFYFSFGLLPEAYAARQPHYQIQAHVDWVRHQIVASQTVSFVNPTKQPLQEIYFHVYPNRRYEPQEKSFMRQYASYFRVNPFPVGFQSPRMAIEQLKVNQKTTAYVIEGEDLTILRIPLTSALAPGQEVQIDLDFNVQIPNHFGRLGWHKNILAASRWYPILSVVDDQGMWHNHPFYPFHRPFFSEAATYDVKLTVPAEHVVIHSGKALAVENQDDDFKEITIKADLPIREFSFALSPDYQKLEEQFNGIQLKIFYLPGQHWHAKQALQNVKDLLSFYQGKFGAYPYEELSVAPVYLGYGGEQMSNMIFLDTRVFGLPKFLNRYLDFLVAHETGHQWFYNLVGTDEFTHMWMEEGVNSYFLLEYLEHKYGPQAKIVEWPKPLSWLLPSFSFRDARDTRYKIVARTNFDRPIVSKLSSFTEPSSIFSLTYGKGAGVVAMLKNTIGEQSFDRVWQRVFKEFQFQNLSQEDFKRICKEEADTGGNLDLFFEQWLHSSDHLDLAIAGFKNNELILKNKGGVVMSTKVRIDYQDGTQDEFMVDRLLSEERIAWDPKKPIKRLSIDPDKELLDIDRVSNHWPRQFRIKWVPLHLPVYDIPVFLPDDSYNMVVGPEFANGGLGLKASVYKPYEQNLYVASDYDFNEQIQHSRLGYQLQHLFSSQTTAGFEVFNRHDYDEGVEDLAGAKVFMRRELWPAPYGVGDINDHVTGYMIRNRSLNGDLISGLNDSRNLSYLKKDEAIIGVNVHFGRSGTYPDPTQGFELNSIIESAGHFLGATQYFYRISNDVSFYQPVTPQTNLAFRLKYGWGYPNDKSLYELGGAQGLRGFDRKTVRGAQGFLGSLEYRFPLWNDLNLQMRNGWLGVESLKGVVFSDAGQAWFDDFDQSRLRKDVGVGLRLMVNVGSFLERALVRLDVAFPINEDDDDTNVWLGLNQAF